MNYLDRGCEIMKLKKWVNIVLDFMVAIGLILIGTMNEINLLQVIIAMVCLIIPAYMEVKYGN